MKTFSIPTTSDNILHADAMRINEMGLELGATNKEVNIEGSLQLVEEQESNCLYTCNEPIMVPGA